MQTIDFAKTILGLPALITLLLAGACNSSQKTTEPLITKQVSSPTMTENITTPTQTQSPNKTTPKILTSIAEARSEIKQAKINQGLQLNIADELWRDSPGTQITGVNMAIIVDAVLERGLMPDGFEQKEGYRIYRYKKADK